MLQNILLVAALISPSNCANIGCFVDGECLDSIAVGVSQQETADQCLSDCKEAETCHQFTFYRDDSVCVLFNDCSQLSDLNCDDCISGDASCDSIYCNEPGTEVANLICSSFISTIVQFSCIPLFLMISFQAPALDRLKQFKRSTRLRSVFSSAGLTLTVNGGTTTARMAFAPFCLPVSILTHHAQLAPMDLNTVDQLKVLFVS